MKKAPLTTPKNLCRKRSFSESFFVFPLDIDLASSGKMGVEGVKTMQTRLYDIAEVCKMLGTTSRTLRFYEQKGIIDSTAVPFCTRRQYSDAQIAHIKQVMVLRSMGMPIAKIASLQDEQGDLSQAILERRAQAIASVTTKYKEIRLLNEALATLENGGDIFAPRAKKEERRTERLAEVERFTDLFLAGNLRACYGFFTPELRHAMPYDDFAKAAEETLRPVGKFVSRGARWTGYVPEVIYSELRYEKLGVYIQLVFCEKGIGGVWLGYCETEER